MLSGGTCLLSAVQVALVHDEFSKRRSRIAIYLYILLAETANGPYFEQAVKVMARTCCEAECSRNYNLYVRKRRRIIRTRCVRYKCSTLNSTCLVSSPLLFQYQSVRNTIVYTYGRLSNGESMASSAVKTSVDVDAKMILVMSETGKMANYVAKFRPGRACMCLTPNQTVARQLSGIVMGMHTIVVDSLEKSYELIQEVSYELIASGLLQIGDTMVVVAGRMAGMKEKMEVLALGPGQKFGHIVPNSAGFFFNRELILAYSDYGSPVKRLGSSGSM